MVLPPQVRIREAGLLSFGAAMVQQESRLQTFALDETENVLRGRGYDLRPLSGQVDLEASVKAVAAQFDNLLEQVKPMEFSADKSRHFGEDVRQLGIATKSDALVLISCRGNHWQRAPGPRGALREGFRYLAIVFAPLRWHQSQVFIKVMVVRASDGLLLWYGDNVQSPGMDIANEAQFRERIRHIFEKFPKRL